jgi:hypothetical protein
MEQEIGDVGLRRRDMKGRIEHLQIVQAGDPQRVAHGRRRGEARSESRDARCCRALQEPPPTELQM